MPRFQDSARQCGALPARDMTQDGNMYVPPVRAARLVHRAAVTAPPSSAELPPYYTQYEEDHSEDEDASEQASPSSPAQDLTPERMPKRNRRPSRRVVEAHQASMAAITSTTSTGQAPKAKRKRISRPVTSKDNAEDVPSDGQTRKTKKAKSSAASTKPKPVRSSKAKQANTQNKADGVQEVKSMHWTIQLTALAIEVRFKNPRILAKFAKKTSDTKTIRAIWEDTINVFQERALQEHAWGDDGPRGDSVKQFKNKLNNIRSGYKKKRTRLLGTGNRVQENSSDEEGDSESPQRKYPEMPVDFFVSYSDESDSSNSDISVSQAKLVCDPLKVQVKYRAELGVELAALWPLLCDAFSRRVGSTGEAITESGLAANVTVANPQSEGDENKETSDSEDSDTPSEACAKAKEKAKAKKRRDIPQKYSTGVKRPIDTVSDTLRSGFETIERVLSVRHQPAPNNSEMTQLFSKLTASIETANATQQATAEALLQSISGLHQITKNLYTEMTNGGNRSSTE
ncbi:hypothetical protein GN958_ATG12011 [Phytophthora infestans]|uniref:Uncharacterized protein n=1 Tax=Phytophthora infestans TaxID=4787 RepID=A0A8S9UH81_PHYIN|nr:hypothetical protein GN958_ATG12011 [Phytophthora infestans]KAI9980812.1 hypothetical protein PInf_010141 [Phytophthora infestans]